MNEVDKDLKDFTYDDLITYITWNVMGSLTSGAKLRNTVSSNVILAIDWHLIQEAKKNSAQRRESEKRNRQRLGFRE